MNFGQALQNLTRIFSDITNVIDLHYQEFLDNTEKSLDLVRIYYEDVIGTFVSPITFSDFQLNILKTFLVILAINLIFIKFYWNKYGDIITDRFIRPSTLKEIEELKLSVARLKLPKEHSPRL